MGITLHLYLTYTFQLFRAFVFRALFVPTATAKDRFDSSFTVGEFMILANKTVAEYLLEKHGNNSLLEAREIVEDLWQLLERAVNEQVRTIFYRLNFQIV